MTFIIKPVALEVYDKALNPYLEREISYETAFDEDPRAHTEIFAAQHQGSRHCPVCQKEAGMKSLKPEMMCHFWRGFRPM